MLNLAFGQSKYFSDNLADNVRRSQRRKVSEGVWSWEGSSRIPQRTETADDCC